VVGTGRFELPTCRLGGTGGHPRPSVRSARHSVWDGTVPGLTSRLASTKHQLAILIRTLRADEAGPFFSSLTAIPFARIFARERVLEYERDLLRRRTYGDELQFTIINRDARFQDSQEHLSRQVPLLFRTIFGMI
jgi:hypothetical protein